MKKLSILFVVLILSGRAFAQGEVAREIGDLIKDGKLDQAEQRDEYYLDKDPRNIDAIMMKGNIILNRYFAKLGDIAINVNQDESIYDPSIGYINGNEDAVIPKETTIEIANLWKKAVGIDNTREDIHKGICTIYSEGLMVQDLIAYLPTVKNATGGDPDFAYPMCDYARNVENRGDFDGAMKVYKAVAALYPEVGGLNSDIAAEYYMHGDIESCRHYLMLALKGPSPDTLTYGNAFFFYSVFGEFEKALDAIKMESKMAHNEEYLLYEGLLEYYKDNPDWKATVGKYVKISEDTANEALADSLLSPSYKESSNNYPGLTKTRVTDAYKILVHLKFMALEPNEFLPHFNYAELLTHSNEYAKAASEFESIEKAGLMADRSDSDNVAFFYGWDLWSLNKKEQALAKWSQLLHSDNFYYKSAAAFFSGKYFLDKHDEAKAKSFFEMVSDQANQSKYATYCWNEMKRLK